MNEIKCFLKNLPVEPETDPIVMGVLDGFTLAAPESFWRFKDAEEAGLVVNGCGPGGTGDFLVPDTAYFLSLKPACKIHDWMFTIFNNEAGFTLSNQVFIDNMTRINQAKTKWGWLRKLRQMRIRTYYRAVRDLGRLFYYDAHENVYEQKEIYA